MRTALVMEMIMGDALAILPGRSRSSNSRYQELVVAMRAMTSLQSRSRSLTPSPYLHAGVLIGQKGQQRNTRSCWYRIDVPALRGSAQFGQEGGPSADEPGRRANRIVAAHGHVNQLLHGPLLCPRGPGCQSHCPIVFVAPFELVRLTARRPEFSLSHWELPTTDSPVSCDGITSTWGL